MDEGLGTDSPRTRRLVGRRSAGRLRRMAECLRRSQDDDGTARLPHTPLRHRRDRQRRLALQKPRLSLTAPSLTPPHSPRLRNPDQLRRGERYPSVCLQRVPIGRKAGVPFRCSLTGDPQVWLADVLACIADWPQAHLSYLRTTENRTFRDKARACERQMVWTTRPRLQNRVGEKAYFGARSGNTPRRG